MVRVRNALGSALRINRESTANIAGLIWLHW